MSADAQYGVYGWTVSVNRSVREFSTLRDAWSGGFQLQGSGSATVVTPAVFKRGRSYRVTVGSRVMSLRADGSRRLRISVPLGPSNKVQEYPLDGPPVATKVYTTTVTIG
jgi:hypothetical protein